MVRLYIIDDHNLIIEGFYSSFDLDSDDFEIAGGSLNIQEALEEISPENVNIIILDLFIKHSNPVTNFNQVQKAFPSIPIVILSYEESLLWKFEMFRLGAKAFLNKNEEKPAMRHTLLRVAAGESVVPKEVAQMLMPYKTSFHGSQFIPDFKQIIDGLAHGLSIKEIAFQLDQSESSIDKKIRKIQEYFGAKSKSELIYKTFANPSEKMYF